MVCGPFLCKVPMGILERGFCMEGTHQDTLFTSRPHLCMCVCLRACVDDLGSLGDLGDLGVMDDLGNLRALGDLGAPDDLRDLGALRDLGDLGALGALGTICTLNA